MGNGVAYASKEDVSMATLLIMIGLAFMFIFGSKMFGDMELYLIGAVMLFAAAVYGYTHKLFKIFKEEVK